MPTIDPIYEARVWLYETLSDPWPDDALAEDVAGRIAEDVAPRGMAAPFVVHQFVSGRPIRVANQIVWFQEDFQVTVGGLSTDQIAPAAVALRARLESAHGETPDALIIDCRAINDYDLTTTEEGENWRRLGGLWRILVKPKPS